MPHRVAQRLLHDAVGGQVYAFRQCQGVPAEGDGDRHATAARRVEQGVQIGQSRLRRGVLAAGAQHAQHAAQLGQAGQRARPDLTEALHQLRRRIGGLVGRRLGLDRDHRHVVGDHVVQLAGDPGPLFNDGLSRVAHEFCFDEDPSCGECPLKGDCPSAQVRKSSPRLKPR